MTRDRSTFPSPVPRAGAEVSQPAPWPLDLLDVPALRRSGTRPAPLRQFVLKTHSRCNLACTYCYIYAGPDSTWRDRPVHMADATLLRTAERIAEHVRRHGLREVRVDFFGGEPLLTGPDPLLRAAEALRGTLPAGTGLDLAVQTNGVLLTRPVLDRLARAGIRVGLSADGGNAALNRRRVDHAGRPSWPALARAARLLGERPDSYSGVLCTIDPCSDPVEVFTSLLDLHPPFLDLLLPHANWSSPPPAGPAGPAPYGRWLRAAFDHWWDADPPGPPVRIFQEIIGLLLGRPSGSETVGLSPMVAIIVDTDGAIEQVDSVKSAYHGASATGLNVFTDSFDAALDHPGVVARQMGPAALAPQCRACPLTAVCGGGNYAHRYLAGSGFRHPSVYCADLELLIRHIADRLLAALPAGASGAPPPGNMP
ncbi:FxsB family cyclophane-forming radical SAM/SPASM peptide maturase [Streptomyces sp. Tu 3180]|uniref:FxsB family cyclophane-forming radical SAM/SPASM peptide maturase n=1 Tax=Streptomyces sp. Tu 3180 TaxID=2682611 RepID=UPI001FB839F5|nr:FxsB family cyclophane-forming radical SAM/SPASM peptide maturase [Streptomyces sp. Tu 3180]